MRSEDADQVYEKACEFLPKYYRDEIGTLAQRYPNEQTSLWIDFRDLAQFDNQLADRLADQPEEVREQFEYALWDYDLPVDIDLSSKPARVRFHEADTLTRKLEELRDDDVEKFRAISGQISKASAVRPVVKEAAWECERCGTMTYVLVENELREPHECQGCERQGPFRLDYHESDRTDHQLIRIKQPPEDASNSGQMGNEIDAHLEGDLVTHVSAGERADVPGVLRAETNGDSPQLDFYFDAWAVDRRSDDFSDLNVEEHRDEVRRIVDEENPFEAIADSVAPGITGGDDVTIETPFAGDKDKYWWIRLASAVGNLFGSWRRPNGDGTFHRGSSHIALFGDPSTGKSTIAKAIEAISPRSASESGKNVSGAGLTAAAVRDDFGDSEWSLEAGALVKAHNGVCIMDEVDKMNKDGLSRLHSALEDQVLNINKAGIDATLKCETSLLAMGNPKDSRFSRYETDHSQIDIVGSLLDRFDLVYTLKDIPDEEKDRQIANAVIERRSESGLVEKGELTEEEAESSKPCLPVELLRAWVAMARQEVQPVIKDDTVKQRLEDYYVNIRQSNAEAGEDGDEPVPTTVRTLDGLLRLSEAAARLRLSEEVEQIDVDVAITLVKLSLEDIGYDPETGKLDADFAEGRGSFSQKDRIAKVKGIIGELEMPSEGADEENVIQTATDAGIDEEKAWSALDKLLTRGEAYTPKTGKVRLS